MLNHLLHNREGLGVAVVVNDVSGVNIDADAIAREGGPSRTEIVIIGQDMDEAVIRAGLEPCLLTKEDLAQEITLMPRDDDCPV